MGSEVVRGLRIVLVFSWLNKLDNFGWAPNLPLRLFFFLFWIGHKLGVVLGFAIFYLGF